jgi:hypothetical protein
MKKQKDISEDLTGAKRRLTDIRPREVSLVDSPANGRKFLIVKRKDGMDKDKLLFKDEDGKKSEETNPSTESNTTPPKAEVTQPEGGDQKTEITKGDFTKAIEKDLEGVSIAKALMSEQKDMFFAMSDALMSFAMGMDMIRSDLMSFADSDGSTGFAGEKVAKAAEGLLEDGMSDATFGKLVALIEKKGRKMKGDRLAKLKGVLEGLSALVLELEEDAMDEKKKDDVKKEEGQAAAPEAKPEEAKEEAKPAEGEAKEEAKPEAEEAKPAEGEAKEEAKPAEEGSEVAKIVEEAVKKAVKPLEDRLQKLEGTPAAPAAEQGEGTEDVSKSEDKDESLFAGVL